MLAKFEVCEEVFNRNGLEFNKNLHKKLDNYAEFLCEYNEKVNLTAITDAEGIFIKHFLDSIFWTSIHRYRKMHALLMSARVQGYHLYR